MPFNTAGRHGFGLLHLNPQPELAFADGLDRQMPFTAECYFCHLVIQNVPDGLQGMSKPCPRCKNSLTLAVMSRARPVAAARSEPRPLAPGLATADRPIQGQPNTEPRSVPQAQELPRVAASVEVIVAKTPRKMRISPPPARQFFKTERRTGLFALCFASLAFMTMAIPTGVWLATALALIALLLGCACLACAYPRSRKDLAAYPGLAIGTGVLIFLAYANRDAFSRSLMTGRSSEAVTGQALVHLRTEGVSRQIEPKDVEWVDASTDAAQVGNVRVRVASAALEAVASNAPSTRPARPEKRLVVRLRVSNAGASQVENYKGWNGFLSDATETGLLLRDEQGRILRPKSETPTSNSRIIQNAEIPPEKWVDDLLVFETPASRGSDLLLELPGAAIGSKDKLRFRIPNAMILHLAEAAGKPRIK